MNARPDAVFSTRELDHGSLPELADRCSSQLTQGGRLVTLFGRPDGAQELVVTAVLFSRQGALEVLRARGRRGERYPALTERHPAAHMLERELWEQLGVAPVGHPWLKPVRFEGDRQRRLNEYPFFSMSGKEVHEVGVGPIHAGIIEPGHFRFMCLGEVVHHLEIQLGYQHRGVEALMLSRNPLQLAPLVEAVAGDSSISHTSAYCAAVETLTGRHLQWPQQIVRGLALELERIAMHLAALAGLATDIAFLQGAATYQRLRTAIINATMRACGSRFGRGWLRPGGVTHGLGLELRNDLRVTLEGCLRDLVEVNELVLGARSVRSRFRGVGVVSKLAAEQVGLLGLSARASGLARDSRVDLPDRLRETFPIRVQLEETGDCWARMHLRMRELMESLRWILTILDSPGLDLDVSLQNRPMVLRSGALCVSLCEGFRGEVVHVLETDRDGKLCHYKVQDPSLQNWFGLALALRGAEISDFPICNKSFDLSYCGADL
jgi:Ni,Fe-hydrogenase III large subunit